MDTGKHANITSPHLCRRHHQNPCIIPCLNKKQQQQQKIKINILLIRCKTAQRMSEKNNDIVAGVYTMPNIHYDDNFLTELRKVINLPKIIRHFSYYTIRC